MKKVIYVLIENCCNHFQGVVYTLEEALEAAEEGGYSYHAVVFDVSTLEDYKAPPPPEPELYTLGEPLDNSIAESAPELIALFASLSKEKQ